MAELPGSSSEIRERNLRLVLETVRRQRPVSRADVAAVTGLSKPTVGAALRSFGSVGLVREFGRTTGRRGPGASLYGFVPEAVLVLAIDIGAQYVRAMLGDLDGRPVQELTLPLARAHADEVLTSIRQVAREIAGLADRTELAVVGTPGIVDPRSGRISAAPNLEHWDGVLAHRVLADALGLPVQVDNDVNLAAIGERTRGAGRGVQSFVYLKVGSGLGAGIVLGGRLHHGSRGAAGEVGFLPVGDEPFAASERAQGGAMEARLSSHALLELAARLAGDRKAVPDDVEELFDAARRGDPLGRQIVDHAARELAVCIAGLTSVLDLELVLLGGGIGVNDDLLLPGVRATVARLVPSPPRIERAVLDERAVCIGALSVGLKIARDNVVSRLTHDNAAVVEA